MCNNLKNILNLINDDYYIKIHTCYSLTVPAEWEIPQRINEDFHIIFVKDGKGKYIFDDASVNLEKGRIILVSAGMKHGAIQDTAFPPSIIPIRFGLYNKNSNEQIKFTFDPFFVDFLCNDFLSYYNYFEDLFNLFNDYEYKHVSILCGSFLVSILLKLYNDTHIMVNKEIYKYKSIQKVKLLIDTNPVKRLSLKDMSNLSGLSSKHFREVFKKIYNINPLEYCILARLKYAKFLLEDSDKTIKEVALLCGYSDPYCFSKQFKKYLGVSPSLLKEHLIKSKH